MEEVIEQVSKELNLPVEVVKEAYTSYYKFIREVITQLPLKEELTEEEFKKLRTNFNLPALGKLYCNYERYTGVKSRFKYAKNLKEEYEHKED